VANTGGKESLDGKLDDIFSFAAEFTGAKVKVLNSILMDVQANFTLENASQTKSAGAAVTSNDRWTDKGRREQPAQAEAASFCTGPVSLPKGKDEDRTNGCTASIATPCCKHSQELDECKSTVLLIKAELEETHRQTHALNVRHIQNIEMNEFYHMKRVKQVEQAKKQSKYPKNKAGNDSEDPTVLLLQEELASLLKDQQQTITKYRKREADQIKQHQMTIADLHRQAKAHRVAARAAGKAQTSMLLLEKKLEATINGSAGMMKLAAQRAYSHQIQQAKNVATIHMLKIELSVAKGTVM
jgi:hypothetical protein